MQALKPCPLCGRQPTINTRGRAEGVVCAQLDHRIQTYGRDGSAITAWNTRPIETNTRTGDTLPARDLTVSELIAEKARIEKLWDDMRADDEFEGGSGSPGEWMYERLNEIDTLVRSLAQSITPPEGGELERVAQMAAFLVDRIDELDWCGDLESFANEWNGHVDPPLSRLRRALSTPDDELVGLGDIERMMRAKGYRQFDMTLSENAGEYEANFRKVPIADLCAESAKKPSDTKGLVDALIVARGQFAFYVEQHALKQPPDEAKAATNQRHVDLIDTALAQHRGSTL